MTASINTYMMLIMPNDYKKVWKEKMGDKKDKPTRYAFRINSQMPSLRFAEIRKSSGRVGECRYRYIEEVGSITLMDNFTPQKRWYKSMIAYTVDGVKNGRPVVEFLYFKIDPWSLQKLAMFAECKK